MAKSWKEERWMWTRRARAPKAAVVEADTAVAAAVDRAVAEADTVAVGVDKADKAAAAVVMTAAAVDTVAAAVDATVTDEAPRVQNHRYSKLAIAMKTIACIDWSWIRVSSLHSFRASARQAGYWMLSDCIISLFIDIQYQVSSIPTARDRRSGQQLAGKSNRISPKCRMARIYEISG
jgi:hypothetical protein